MGPNNSNQNFNQYIKHHDIQEFTIRNFENEEKFNKYESNENLFEFEQKSPQDLKDMLSFALRYNTYHNPWDNTIVKKDKNGIPKWAQKYSDEYRSIDQLIILAQRNRYFLSQKNEKFRRIYIGGGCMIDLKLNIQYQIKDPQKQRQIMFFDNERASRPSASKRFKSIPFWFYMQEENALLTDDQQKQKSKEFYNLGYVFHNQNGQKQLSIKQIFDGLMVEMEYELSQQSKLDETKQQLKQGVHNHYQAWKYIFECLGFDVTSNEKIEQTQYDEPYSTITKQMIFIYSLETFLPYSLNLAYRNGDSSKVLSLGPYASVLREITKRGQTKRKEKLNSTTSLYRGVSVPEQIFEEYKNKFQQKQKLTLDGFQSTSLSKEVAFGFMFNGVQKNDVPILFQFSNLDDNGMFYFQLDSDDYSIYPDEKEVLLDTGMRFDIIKISKHVHECGLTYQLIQLKWRIL